MNILLELVLKKNHVGYFIFIFVCLDLLKKPINYLLKYFLLKFKSNVIIIFEDWLYE